MNQKEERPLPSSQSTGAMKPNHCKFVGTRSNRGWPPHTRSSSTSSASPSPAKASFQRGLQFLQGFCPVSSGTATTWSLSCYFSPFAFWSLRLIQPLWMTTIQVRPQWPHHIRISKLNFQTRPTSTCLISATTWRPLEPAEDWKSEADFAWVGTWLVPISRMVGICVAVEANALAISLVKIAGMRQEFDILNWLQAKIEFQVQFFGPFPKTWLRGLY